MGWDAYSSVNYLYDQRRIENAEHDAAFKSAAKEVTQLAGTVDGYLETGGLDCSACCKMLQEATGDDCYDEEGWSSERVKQLNERADWRIPYGKDDAWAYWSARKFLELCAQFNLSIRFSW